MSFASLGNIYVNLGETSLAIDSLKKAYELRERVSQGRSIPLPLTTFR